MMSAWQAARRDRLDTLAMLNTATAVKIATIEMTSSSSMRVNPAF